MAYQLYRTVEPGISLLSTAEVCVAVQPVGHIPREVLDGYMDAISRFKHVSLSASRSFYRDPPLKTPFEYLDWSTGCMHFRFQQAELCRRRSRLVDLHWQRQVIAVIGLVYCPLTNSVEAAYDEFCRTCRAAYPGCLVQRCFVVEPSEEQLRQTAGSHMRDMVMFPPGGLAHFRQHLEVWMHDLTALILTELEKWVLEATSVGETAGKPASNNSYADNPEFTGSNSMMEEVAKRLTLSDDDEAKDKKRWARLLKAKGDACCMAGTPLDAYEHYKTCAEVCKTTNDLVWYGAALECLASTRLLMIMSGLSPPTALPLFTQTSNSSSASTSQPLNSDSSQQQGQPTGQGVLNLATRSEPVSDTGNRVQTPPTVAAVRSQSTAANGLDTGPQSKQLLRKSTNIGFNPRVMWEAARRSGVEQEIRDMLAEARAAYRKRGGCPALLLEQNLKLIRLAVGARGISSAHKEVLEMAIGVLELMASLHYPEDRVTAMVEVAQVMGCLGYTRRRTLLLWQALEMGRALPAPVAAPPGPQKEPQPPCMERSELVRLAAIALEPPQDLVDSWAMPSDALAGAGASTMEGSVNIMRCGSGRNAGMSDLDSPAPAACLHFAQMASLCSFPTPKQLAWLPFSMWCKTGKGSFPALGSASNPAHAGAVPLCGMWETVRLGLLEAALSCARQAGAGVDAWEAAAALLRDHHVGMSTTTQANLLEVMASAAAASPAFARHRPRLGLPLVAQLRRVLQHKPPLQPCQLSVLPTGKLGPLSAGNARAAAAGGVSPFIFSAKRPTGTGNGAAKGKGDTNLASSEWVCGEECCVEISLMNPLAVPLRLEQVHLVMSYTPLSLPHTNSAPLMLSNVGSRSPSVSQLTVAGSAPPAGLPHAGISEQPPVRYGVPHSMMTPNHNDSPAWQPLHVSAMLAPRGKPTKLLLIGRATQPGIYTLTSIRASVSGASWVHPLLPPGTIPRALQIPISAGNPRPPPPPELPTGRGRHASTALPAPLSIPLTVLPELPLLKLQLTAPSATLTAPTEEELGTGSLPTPGSAGMLPKSDTITVWEGQLATWKLTLTNVSANEPITHIDAQIVNSKGFSLKVFGSDHLHAAVAGPHMELDISSLAAALPLMPGKSLTLPVAVHVGRLPKRPVQEEISLGVRVLYANVPGAQSSQSVAITALADGTVTAGSQQTQQLPVTGRCTQLTVPFRVESALQISHVSFADYFTPSVHGTRLTHPHTNVKAAVKAMQGRQPGPNQHVKGGRNDRVLPSGTPGMSSLQPQASSQHMAALDLSISTRLSMNSRSQSLSKTLDLALEMEPQGQSMEIELSHTSIAALASRHAKPADIHVGDRRPSMNSEDSKGLPTLQSSFSLSRGSNSMLQMLQSSAPEPSPETSRAVTGNGRDSCSGKLSEPKLKLRLVTDTFLSLVVHNDSQRYFRVWLTNISNATHVNQLAVSEGQGQQEVLQPGDRAILWAYIHNQSPQLRGAVSNEEGVHNDDATTNSHPGVNQPSNTAHASSSLLLPTDFDRLAAAETLAATWAVCYQLISGDTTDEGNNRQPSNGIPHGIVRLAAMDAARGLTPAAAAALLPAPVQFSLELDIPPSSQVSDASHETNLETHAASASVPITQRPVRLRNLAPQVSELGACLANSVTGELWGYQLHIGCAFPLQIVTMNTTNHHLHIHCSVIARAVNDTSSFRQGLKGNRMQRRQSAAPSQTGAFSTDIDVLQTCQDVIFVGERDMDIVLGPGHIHVHSLQLICLQPCFYQIYVSKVLAAVVLPPVQANTHQDSNLAATAAESRGRIDSNEGITNQQLQQELSMKLGEMMGVTSTRHNNTKDKQGSSIQGGDRGKGKLEGSVISQELPVVPNNNTRRTVLQSLLESWQLAHASALQPILASSDKLNILAVFP